jgi:hypothetical protein
MSANSNEPTTPLATAVEVLRACAPLADRLQREGIIVELTPAELVHLGKFEKLVNSDFSESDWGYLRVASGVKLRGVAALTSCLSRHRAVANKVYYD